MTEHERKQVAEMWITVSALYQRDIPRQTLGLILDAVNDLPAGQVLEHLKLWVNNPRNRNYPLPGEIRALVLNQIDPKDVAREVATSIVHAISKFGYNNSSSAEHSLGPKAWRIVERFGGWNYLCENLGDQIDVTTFIAQARDLAESETKHGVEALELAAKQIPRATQIAALLGQGCDLNRAIEQTKPVEQ